MNARLAAMENSSKDISGEINIKTSSIPGEHIVPQLIAEFHKHYPKVSFYVEQSDSDKVWNDILDNMGDIGFTGDYRGNELKCELLLKDSLVLITPKTEKIPAPQGRELGHTATKLLQGRICLERRRLRDTKIL